MKESLLSLKKKQHNIGLPSFKLRVSTKKNFMTDLLNIMFDDFGIWLLGYRIKFSCLYIPHGYYFGYEVQIKKIFFSNFEQKSSFNMGNLVHL